MIYIISIYFTDTVIFFASPSHEITTGHVFFSDLDLAFSDFYDPQLSCCYLNS